MTATFWFHTYYGFVTHQEALGEAKPLWLNITQKFKKLKSLHNSSVPSCGQIWFLVMSVRETRDMVKSAFSRKDNTEHKGIPSHSTSWASWFKTGSRIAFNRYELLGQDRVYLFMFKFPFARSHPVLKYSCRDVEGEGRVAQVWWATPFHWSGNRDKQMIMWS